MAGAATAAEELLKALDSGSFMSPAEIVDACEKVELGVGFAGWNNVAARAETSNHLRPVAALQVLALLVQGDKPSARFAYQRFEQGDFHDDLTSAASLCKALYVDEFEAFFKTASTTTWNLPQAQRLAALLVEAVRAQQLELLSKVYGQRVPLTQICKVTGMDSEQATAHCLAIGWRTVSDNDIVMEGSDRDEKFLMGPASKPESNKHAQEIASLEKIQQLSDLVMKLDRKLFTDVAPVVREGQAEAGTNAPETGAPSSSSSSTLPQSSRIGQ